MAGPPTPDSPVPSSFCQGTPQSLNQCPYAGQVGAQDSEEPGLSHVPTPLGTQRGLTGDTCSGTHPVLATWPLPARPRAPGDSPKPCAPHAAPGPHVPHELPSGRHTPPPPWRASPPRGQRATAAAAPGHPSWLLVLAGLQPTALPTALRLCHPQPRRSKGTGWAASFCHSGCQCPVVTSTGLGTVTSHVSSSSLIHPLGGT